MVIPYPLLANHSPEEVEAATRLLEEHYGEPVYPVSQVCARIDLWIDAMLDLAKRSRASGETWFHGAHYVDHLTSVRLDISKSSMLGRLLYGKEKHRKRPCPVHNGSWSGLAFLGGEPPCGCDLTGWLPEP